MKKLLISLLGVGLLSSCVGGNSNSTNAQSNSLFVYKANSSYIDTTTALNSGPSLTTITSFTIDGNASQQATMSGSGDSTVFNEGTFDTQDINIIACTEQVGDAAATPCEDDVKDGIIENINYVYQTTSTNSLLVDGQNLTNEPGFSSSNASISNNGNNLSYQINDTNLGLTTTIVKQ